MFQKIQKQIIQNLFSKNNQGFVNNLLSTKAPFGLLPIHKTEDFPGPPLCWGGDSGLPPFKTSHPSLGKGVDPTPSPPPRWLTNSDATVFGVCCGFLPPVSQLEFLYQQSYVVSISENSPLRVCNVKRGDTILKWAENVVTNRDTFHRIYQQAKYDKAVTLVVCFCFLFFCFFPQRPMGLLVCV